MKRIGSMGKTGGRYAASYSADTVSSLRFVFFLSEKELERDKLQPVSVTTSLIDWLATI